MSAFYPYDFDHRFAAMWLAFGARPGRDGVTLTDDELHFHTNVSRVMGFRDHSALTVTVADLDGLEAALQPTAPHPPP